MCVTNCFVLRRFFRELPTGHFPIFEHRAALRPMDFDARGMTGPDRGAAFDDAHRSTLELDHRAREVFNFKAFMSDECSLRGHAVYRPHKPEQQIDLMDALIHQNATTIELPSPSPSAARVIRIVTMPFDVRIAQHDFSESPLSDRVVYLAWAIGESILKDTAKFYARVIHCFHKSIDAIGRNFEGFFRDDVFPRRGARLCYFQSRPTRHAEANDIHVVPIEKLLIVGKCRTTEFFSNPRRAWTTGRTGGANKFGAVYFYDTLGMNRRDIAATNDAETDGRHLFEDSEKRFEEKFSRI